ncbi:hypothetical protein [Sphingobacterium sp. PCS056]|nr:hypothetical protein [Sphingobacterium sp. PCS056]
MQKEIGFWSTMLNTEVCITLALEQLFKNKKAHLLDELSCT